MATVKKPSSCPSCGEKRFIMEQSGMCVYCTMPEIKLVTDEQIKELPF